MQEGNAKHIDVVMPMYNLLENSDNNSKTSGSLWIYYRDEPTVNDGTGDIIDFPGSSASFKFNQKITGQPDDDGRKDVKTMVSLKCLINFWWQTL